MKNCNALENQTRRRILPIACATALAAAFTVSLPQPAHADQVTPPPVPTNIQVAAGNKAFLEDHGIGTQNYICLPSDSGFAWTLFTPQATLFNDDDKQVTTHFKCRQFLFVAHHNRLKITLTRTANYAVLRWQPVMQLVRLQLSNEEAL